MDKYKLIFSGQIKPDKQKDVLGRFLCKFLNISESNIDKLFSGRSFALRSNLSQQNVYELQAKLEQAGILTKVIREQQLEEEVTFQDTTQRSNTGQESVVSTDYKMRVGERTICRHCGSHLDTTPGQSLAVVDHTGVTTVLTEQAVTSTQSLPLLTTSESQIVLATKTEVPPIKDAVLPQYEVSTDIQNMDVSDTWKKRFEILEKAGIKRLSFKKFFFGEGLKNLPRSESRAVLFPISIALAGMFGGIFNYLFRGLIRKGLFIGTIVLSTYSICEAIAASFGYSMSPKIIQIFGGVLFSQFCCYDVYKLKVQKESFWPELPKILGNPFLLILMFVTSLGICGAIIYENS